LPDIASHPESLLPGANYTFAATGYKTILSSENSQFPRWLFNSFFVAVVITLGHLILDSMAGYALARIKFPGRGIAFIALIGTMMIPAIVLLIPRFLVLRQLGMLNSYTGLIIPYLADAFGIFLMKQFFEGIPAEVEEAAMMDGASRTRLFFTIILPMATPALTALAIFGFQGAWNDFTNPLITVIGEQSLWTLPLGLAQLRGNTGSALQWDQLLAGAVITTLPMAIIFFVFQRFFMESANYTAVKG
jgi:multiple sugar transport system permease protein